MSSSRSPILVINNGSSSLKFSVFSPKSGKVLTSGLAERIGTEQGLLKLSDLEGVKHERSVVTAADDGNPRAQQAIDFSVDDIVYIIALTAIQATPSLNQSNDQATEPVARLL
jgi:acetate kinase